MHGPIKAELTDRRIRGGKLKLHDPRIIGGMDLRGDGPARAYVRADGQASSTERLGPALSVRVVISRCVRSGSSKSYGR